MRFTIPRTSFVVVFCALFVDNIVASQRQLSTECTFSNGTLGTKCVGTDACGGYYWGPDITNIGCGSCIGDYSCDEVSPFTTVGEESCIGYQACAYGKSIEYIMFVYK